MKKLASLLLTLLLVAALSGCAMSRTGMKEGAKVKCPACGYEFNMPSDA